MLVAKAANLVVDLVPDFSRLFQGFLVRSREFGRIWKRPVQTRGHARKNRTRFGFRLIANRDHVGKQFARLKNIEHRLSFVSGDVDRDFVKYFNSKRVQFAGL